MHARLKIGIGALGAGVLSLALGAGMATPALATSAGHASAARVASRPEFTVRGCRNVQESSNWSGYAETGGGYTSVSGSWNVPTADTSQGGTTYGAQWIGIDGDGDNNLIQTGTSVVISGHTASYGVWWEILPAAETPINEPVAPGETITASIVKQSSGKWLIKISNGSWSFSITKSYSGPGDSVEAIVEAPEVGGNIAKMAHTSNVTFSDLTENGANPELTRGDGIKCVQNGKTVETPSYVAAGDSFTMAYGSKRPPRP